MLEAAGPQGQGGHRSFLISLASLARSLGPRCRAVRLHLSLETLVRQELNAGADPTEDSYTLAEALSHLDTVEYFSLVLTREGGQHEQEFLTTMSAVQDNLLWLLQPWAGSLKDLEIRIPSPCGRDFEADNSAGLLFCFILAMPRLVSFRCSPSFSVHSIISSDIDFQWMMQEAERSWVMPTQDARESSGVGTTEPSAARAAYRSRGSDRAAGEGVDAEDPGRRLRSVVRWWLGPDLASVFRDPGARFPELHSLGLRFARDADDEAASLIDVDAAAQKLVRVLGIFRLALDRSRLERIELWVESPGAIGLIDCSFACRILHFLLRGHSTLVDVGAMSLCSGKFHYDRGCCEAGFRQLLGLLNCDRAPLRRLCVSGGSYHLSSNFKEEALAEGKGRLHFVEEWPLGDL